MSSKCYSNVSFSLVGSTLIDPFLASYAVENPIYAVTQVAQTVARSELVKITFEQTFQEREDLYDNIMVRTITAHTKTYSIMKFRKCSVLL